MILFVDRVSCNQPRHWNSILTSHVPLQIKSLRQISLSDEWITISRATRTMERFICRRTYRKTRHHNFYRNHSRIEHQVRLKPESERQAAPKIVRIRNMPQACPRATNNSEALVVRAAGSSLYAHFQHIRLSTMLCNFLSSIHVTTLFSRKWSPMTKESGLTIWRPYHSR